MDPIEQIKIDNKISVNELIKKLESSGVMGAGKLATSVNISEEMIKDKDCTVFLGAAGPLVPGGMKQILIDLLKNKWIDVLVTTGATLTHDLGEALGHNHYKGSEKMDDKELNKKGLDRMYNSLMSNDIYTDLEKFFEDNFDKLKDKTTVKELLWEIGKLTPNESILKIAEQNKIPVFCPALSDSGIGLMIWGQLAKGKSIATKEFDDLKEIMDISWTSSKTGVIYLGGGVPKNYIQQSMQLAPKSAQYGVQITMDRPEPGGSSGAELKEGISWGKLNSKAQFVDVISDVTIALPIIFAALKERIGKND
tara:strand:- start:1019 stop:1945 length:927 start_codon:yes stop_codon:yes gene_type:complete